MAEFVNSPIAELNPDAALSRHMQTCQPTTETTEMTSEPGNLSNDREEKIRRRAHEIWEKSGRPENSHEANWFEAAKQIDAEETSPVHPETSGASASDRPVLPDPFAKRRVTRRVSGDSPRPKDAGDADPLKSQ